MKIKIVRTISNRSCTMGVMTVEGTDIRLFTREDKRPTYDDNYIKHCLRPGVYKLRLEYGAIDIGNKMVRGYWPMFERVPWFPNASFCVASNYGCRFGRINVGTSMPDEFSVDGAMDAIKTILRMCKEHMTPVKVTNEDGTETTITPEPVTVEIIESPDMEIHDYTRQQYEAEQEAEREKREQEELEREIYSPASPASPPSPPDGGMC